jgi:hypothetical protein
MVAFHGLDTRPRGHFSGAKTGIEVQLSFACGKMGGGWTVAVQLHANDNSSKLAIDYSTAPSRRKWARRVGWALLLAITLGAAVQWGPRLWRQAQILSTQRRCMSFTLPADFVAYEEDPLAAAALLAREPQSYAPYRLARQRGSVATQPAPTRAAMYQDTTLLAQHFPGAPGLGGQILLHELQTPSGKRRLVMVRYHPEKDTFTPAMVVGYNVDVTIVTPATAFSLPVARRQDDPIDVTSGFPPHPPNVRIFAGQPDPGDPSHFTIRYQMWGQEDIVDGRLDDHERITLTQRHMPEWTQ